MNVDEAKALFYTSAGAQTLFVDYISLVRPKLSGTLRSCEPFLNQFQTCAVQLANRVNTVNGRLYKNDPVIMAWDIINEPHCVNTTRCSDTTVSDFVSNVYNYLKNTLGVAQLVTVGTDGFYNDPTNTQSNVYPVSGGLNPFADAVNTGADFVALCKLVDFCEFNVR